MSVHKFRDGYPCEPMEFEGEYLYEPLIFVEGYFWRVNVLCCYECCSLQIQAFSIV